MEGRVVSLNVSVSKGTRKERVSAAQLVVDHGIAGDAHAGPWHRQISLLAIESIAKSQAKAIDLKPGDFAENITTSGLDLAGTPIGTRFKVGECEIEITQIGKSCHRGCEIRELVGDCVMPREGIFARVLTGGWVKPGDAIVEIPHQTI